MVELVKTHTFIRKHATGKAKIELHVLTVERGLSWEAAKEKWENLVGNPSEEGFYISHQVRNGKSTAILAAATEKSSRYKALAEKGSKKKDKTFIVYRPNTGQQVGALYLYVCCSPHDNGGWKPTVGGLDTHGGSTKPTMGWTPTLTRGSPCHS